MPIIKYVFRLNKKLALISAFGCVGLRLALVCVER